MARETETGSVELLLLGLLQGRELYGYQMVTELAARSSDLFQLKEGTLYPLLHRMEQERLIEAHERIADGRKRRYYRLTERGQGRLKDKRSAWESYVEAVNAILEPDGAQPV